MRECINRVAPAMVNISSLSISSLPRAVPRNQHASTSSSQPYRALSQNEQHVAQKAKSSALRQVVSHVQPHALGGILQTSGSNGILCRHGCGEWLCQIASLMEDLGVMLCRDVQQSAAARGKLQSIPPFCAPISTSDFDHAFFCLYIAVIVAISFRRMSHSDRFQEKPR